MENEEIKTVSIEDFKTNENIIDYIDDDFAIVNSLEGAPHAYARRYGYLCGRLHSTGYKP